MMKTIYLRIGSLFISALMLAPLAAHAQEGPLGGKQGDTRQPAVERDKEKEEQVAKLFEGIRAEAKLPQLERIGHRPQLEQGVCTSALTGSPYHGAASYITTDPGSMTPELKKVASSNRLDQHKRPWFTRYSVA